MKFISVAGLLFVGITLLRNRAFAFEFKKLSPNVCMSVEFSLALSDAQRSLGLKECETSVQDHAILNKELSSLQKLTPMTEEKVAEFYGKDWQEKLIELRRKVKSLLFSQVQIRKDNNRIPVINKFLGIDETYLKSISSNYDSLLDQVIAATASHRIEMKDYTSARRALGAIAIEYRRNEDQGKMPRSNYLDAFLTCSQKSGNLLLSNESACKLVEKLKPDYMALIQKDNAANAATAIPSKATSLEPKR